MIKERRFVYAETNPKEVIKTPPPLGPMPVPPKTIEQRLTELEKGMRVIQKAVEDLNVIVSRLS